VTRVDVIIFHPRAASGAGPLSDAFAAIRGRNAQRQALGFRQGGAEVTVVEDLEGNASFGRRVRDLVGAIAPDGLVLLGSGSVQWWPRGNKANKFEKSWTGFAALLDEAIRR